MLNAVDTVSGTQTGGTGAALRAGSVPAPYAALIQQAGTTCRAAPPSVLAAQLEAESGWNTAARSPVGAQGLAQFMPDTWRTWGRDGNGDGTTDVWNPADAIASQAAYDCALAEQMTAALRTGQVTGDLTDLMLAAYNAGPQAVLAAHGIPPFPETRSYVTKITSRAASYSNTTGTITGTITGTGFGARLIAAAMSQQGVPYSWGGGTFTGPSQGFARGAGTVGFDCSGLVLFAAYQASAGTIRLPHSADQQTRTGTLVSQSQLQPGDVISFTRPGETEAHHVGIYLGTGRMINAPSTGKTVEIDSLTTPYWENQTWRAVRYSS
jgi:cell wall-associated NlpC family hydrolase